MYLLSNHTHHIRLVYWNGVGTVSISGPDGFPQSAHLLPILV